MRCPRCQSDNHELALRCALCGASVIRTSQPPVAVDAELAVPERREATLLFADVQGYTELAESADVEDVAALMNAIKEGAAEIVRTYGGVVNQFIGDEIMAVFGLPCGNEDDPRRAISAALELHAFVSSARIVRLLRGRAPLALHTGISTGLVLAHSHDLREGVFHVTGAAVNLAARLRALAGRDEILVSAATHELISPFFRTEQLPTAALKGIAEPVTPYRVQAPGALRSSFDLALERGLTPYVGRRTELATLENYLAEAGRGQGRLVSLVGPPGVGKTRLVHELTRRAEDRGFCVLRGRCQSYGNIPPFQPFLETLADAVGLRDASAPDAAERVVRNVLALQDALAQHLPVYLYLLGLRDEQRPLPPELHGQALRRAVIAGLGDILIALGKRGPLLVIVEDWHWADEASDALFRDLARATKDEPIMALVTYRPDQLSDTRRPLTNRHLTLGPFGEMGTANLLRELLHSEELPEDLARHVHRTTDGNPFFIEELCHALIDAGALVHSADSWLLTKPLAQLNAPSSVQAMVRARVDRLARSDKELLKLASVIGAEFTLDLLEPLCDESREMTPGLERLESRAHILQLDAASFRFKHPIVHDVVYNVLLLQRRRELHGAIARLIEARNTGRSLELYYEALAHHYGRSDERERAVLYAELAGRKAERTFSLDQARVHYAQAIEALDELPPTAERMRKRVDLSVRWAGALVHNPAPGQVQVLLRSLEYATRLDYTIGVARCLTWTGWLEYTLGNQDSAIAYNQRCLALRAQVDDRRVMARAESNIGMSCVMAARYDEAEEYLGRALASVAPSESSSAAAGTGYGLGHLALLAADRGEFTRGDELLEQGKAVLRQSGHYALLGALSTIGGIMSVLRGDFAGAGRAAQHVREVAERIDGSYQRHMGAALDGLCALYTRDDRQGINALRGAALGLESRGMGLALSFTFAALAEALWHAGEYDEALVHAESALRRASSGDALGEVSALRVRALARHQKGLPGAEQDLARASELATKKRSRRDALLVRLAQGACELAPRDQQLGAQLEAMSMPWHAARA